MRALIQVDGVIYPVTTLSWVRNRIFSATYIDHGGEFHVVYQQNDKMDPIYLGYHHMDLNKSIIWEDDEVDNQVRRLPLRKRA